MPPPVPFDAPLSPTQSKSSSENPTLDDLSSNPALRLPSITRHGFLVEDASQGQRLQGPGATLPEANRIVEMREEEDVESGESCTAKVAIVC